MKKLVLTTVMVLLTSMTYAENDNNNSANTAAAYDMTVNINQLAKALDLNGDQIESLTNIHSVFCEEMMNAAAQMGEARSEALVKAVDKDLAHMRYLLTRKQYKRYLSILNTTLNNRGLSVEYRKIRK